MRAHFIDVGQGAATLVEFPCAAVLIDAGGESNDEFDSTESLVGYLDAFFAKRPDLQGTLASLILTHPHKDHTLGVPAVLARYRVRNAVTNGMQTGSGRVGQIALHDAVAAAEETPDTSDDMGPAAIWQKDIPKTTGLTSAVIDPVNCGAVDPKITVLWGQVGSELSWNKTDMANANNHSVVVRIDFGRASMLVSGDLEKPAMASLVQSYAGTHLLDVDVIEVNHHGSDNGMTDAFLKATTPDYAVIEMGPETRTLPWTAYAYGHPRKVTVDLLQKYVAKSRAPTSVRVATGVHAFVSTKVTKAIYGTGWDGTVILEADVNGGWRVVDETVGPAPLVNINTATADQLVVLPMIGPTRAQAIVDSRTTAGPFASIEDLQRVPGIKAGTMSAVRNLVTVGP